MKKLLNRQFFINLSYYILGFFVVGLGVNILRSSNLGMGAWDTVTFNIYDYLYITLQQEWVLVGYVSMFVSIVIFLIVFIYRRSIKMIIMLVPVIIMGNVINFWYYLVFNGYVETNTTLQLLLFVIGSLTLPLGLALVIKSNFPAFVFDEFTFMLGDVFKSKNFGKVRLFIEILGLSIGAVFGYLAYFHVNGTLGAVTLGSLVLALVFGKILHFYLWILGVYDKEATLKEKLHKIYELIDNTLKAMYIELTIPRLLKYLAGMIGIAVGVSFMLKSHLGNSSWDTLHFSMEHLFSITFGTATIIVAMTILVIVIIMNKDIKFILMAIPILIVGPLLDLSNNILQTSIIPETFLLQVGNFILGLTLLPLGGALLLISTYPAGVFDELNVAIVRKLKLKSLVPTRVIMELSAVTVAFIFFNLAGFTYEEIVFEDYKILTIIETLFTDITIGNIGLGTIIFAFTVGPYLKTYLKIFERIGLNENQQTD